MEWENSKMCALVLLDVRNAFNSPEWSVILSALERRGVSPYLRRLTSSYLSDRWITESGRRYEMTAGVPQGSVLGPTLWNIAYDEVLRLRMPKEVLTLAYADDLAVLAKAKSTERLEADVNEALESIAFWMSSNHLELAPGNTEAILLKRRRGAAVPQFTIQGHAVTIQQSARYLGVVMETGLTGINHVRKTAQRAVATAAQIARILPRTHGASENQRRLLGAVAESVMLYAAPVWAPYALRFKTNLAALDRAQRTTGIRITRCYRTVSSEAICVLAQTVPWSLLAEERTTLYQESEDFEEDDEDRLPKELVRQETLNRRQERWDAATTGRRTWKCIPNIRRWMDRSFGELSYHPYHPDVDRARGLPGVFVSHRKSPYRVLPSLRGAPDRYGGAHNPPLSCPELCASRPQSREYQRSRWKDVEVRRGVERCDKNC